MSFSNHLDSVYPRLVQGVRVRKRDLDWRLSQLRALRRLIDENEPAILDALWKDLRKPAFECSSNEHGLVRMEINDAIKHLRRWMKPKRVRTAFYNQPGRSLIYREPYGLTLILGAWNYPFQLTLAPLVGAIAGGNGALIKPPELTPATSALIASLIPRYLDPDLFAVLEGGKDEVEQILTKKFDLIFFTGGSRVGSIIMTAAAKHLTPVVLELGGKSPAIVARDADLKVTARRLAWGKFMNAGQTCVAPDYILVEESVREKLVAELRASLRDFYGDNPQASRDYCRMVNERAFDRVSSLVETSSVLHGGRFDRADLFMEPTLISADASSPAMQDEIFGPVLPIVSVANVDEALRFVNERPKPLALYVFTRDRAIADRFMRETTSGGLLVNDVVMHLPQPDLPFGGVGPSGMGAYHGRFSFDAFTHAKGVLMKSFAMDVPARYAPYTPGKFRILKWLFS